MSGAIIIFLGLLFLGVVMTAFYFLIYKASCPSDCSSNGYCYMGNCNCKSDFSGLDCSVKKEDDKKKGEIITAKESVYTIGSWGANPLPSVDSIGNGFNGPIFTFVVPSDYKSLVSVLLKFKYTGTSNTRVELKLNDKIIKTWATATTQSTDLSELKLDTLLKSSDKITLFAVTEYRGVSMNISDVLFSFKYKN